jgi:catechol 2,3-dioxygenase-like lactoylglutathione lyase family enzyme
MSTSTSKHPGISSLHHVAIAVQNLQQSVTFYKNVLGLTELAAPSSAVENGIRWFDLGDSRALHLIETGDMSPNSRAHFAITVEDADAWRAFIQQTGTEILEPTIDLYRAKRFFMRDPSGNRLELVQWLDE